MTAALTGDPQKRDDLTVIGGIGAARAKILRESLGVHTFQDLASLSADEIESQLRQHRQFVSRDDIEQWIAQAQELATAGGNEQENAVTAGSGWESAATFVVEFQVSEDGEERRTRVHHMEEDVDAAWPDLEHVQLCRWMLEQLGETAPELPEKVRAEAQRELQQELQQMRSEAQQVLQAELESKRSRLQQEIEQELKERKAEAHVALQEEISEARTNAQRELDEELQAERNHLQKEFEEELENRTAEAQDVLQQELEETRAKAQKALEQELQRMRAEAREALAPEPEEPAEEEEAPEPELEAPAEVEGAPEPVAVEQPPELRIGEFRVYQPPQAEAPRVVGKSPSSPDALRRDIPFSLAGSFSVDEAQADELAGKGATYTAQIYAREISTGEIRQLGTIGPKAFIASKSTYEVRLPDVTLPAGFYLVTAFVSTDTTPPGGLYRQVSTFLIA